MFIRDIVVGPLQVNCYIIADEVSKKTMVVDPGDEPDMIMDIIKQNNLTVEYIVCTHGHFDHAGAVADIKRETGAKVVVHKDELQIYNSAKDMGAFWGFELEEQPEPDMLIEEDTSIRVGELYFDIFHSPGHSPGGICLYGNGIIITGDTLFADSVGRTDLPYGDIEKLKHSFRRLMALPESTKVLPGHGPVTTIGKEKRDNLFSEEFL
ncbi:MAG: MBL fold metallo-hydrolase [Thermodesulfovibrio sp.]|nr:MBL fold metallo-hydrolase [Thermodesulfovibrio sp.]